MASGPRRLHTITLFERSRCLMAADSRPRGGTARRGCTRFLHKVPPHWFYIALSQPLGPTRLHEVSAQGPARFPLQGPALLGRIYQRGRGVSGKNLPRQLRAASPQEPVPYKTREASLQTKPWQALGFTRLCKVFSPRSRPAGPAWRWVGGYYG